MVISRFQLFERKHLIKKFPSSQIIAHNIMPETLVAILSCQLISQLLYMPC